MVIGNTALLVVLVAAALWAVSHKGADLPGIALGMAIGVYGAHTIIGRVVQAIPPAVVDLFGSIRL